MAAMAQAQSWGRIQQQFMLNNHAPTTLHTPCVLFVQSQPQDTVWPVQALRKQGMYCSTSIADLPFSWLWRHRAHHDAVPGIIHFYRPGAFPLNCWQRQQLLLKIWLARQLGIGIISTDTGGYWHNAGGLRYVTRRAFEDKIFARSHIVLTFTRHAEQFYRTLPWRDRASFLAHPGLREVLPKMSDSATARMQLGIQAEADFVYLCLAFLHTEREVIQCMEAFSELRIVLLKSEATATLNPQLLLLGTPIDKTQSAKILKRAALNSAIHVFLEYQPADLAMYVAATNALVLPYATVRMAGVPELAMLFYSYERIVISPNLPRFHGLLPPHGGILYNPGSHTSLVQALLLAPKRTFKHTEKEAAMLHYQHGWRNYALLLLDTYKTLLSHLTKKKN
ncbi:hypothetical protein KDK_31540 [Dictyobacter kobayashii]|uniref:Glycosyl transferase family 1 domain-containing protein n=2 Tax=Dictyobacter kobayashii TaxID=2014872 RepID=A0A402AJX2_9CHLR|nr:hypothetical protein KDK_31540 [Dictyobacter kobayashii]